MSWCQVEDVGHGLEPKFKSKFKSKFTRKTASKERISPSASLTATGLGAKLSINSKLTPNESIKNQQVPPQTGHKIAPLCGDRRDFDRRGRPRHIDENETSPAWDRNRCGSSVTDRLH